jgi:hypothetical protein
MDEATRATAIASLKKYFHEDVLVTNRFKLRQFPKGSTNNYYILEGPGIGSWGVLGDAGKFSANLLETLWAYAHFTGDWDLIRERWPLVKKLFITPVQARWVGFSRDEIAETTSRAVPGVARRHKVGDIINYACRFRARTGAPLAEQRGAKYFRENQPWHSMEAMDEFISRTFGAHLAELANRRDEYRKPASVNSTIAGCASGRRRGAFLSRYLKADVQREGLALLQTRWPEKHRWNNDSHICARPIAFSSAEQTPAELANRYAGQLHRSIGRDRQLHFRLRTVLQRVTND